MDRCATLSDAIGLAYETNPVLREQRAAQRSLDETLVQADSGYQPTLSAQGSVGIDTNSYSPNQLTPGQVASVPGKSVTSSTVLNVTQPIYTGGRLSSQVAVARANISAGREQLRATEESVLQSVVEAYSNVLRDEEIVFIAKASAVLLQDELRDTGERSKAGEVTRTDVSQAQARLAATQAQLAATEAQLADSRASYLAAVGQNPSGLEPVPSMDRWLPSTLDEALAAAERHSPILSQSVFSERASASRVDGVRAQTRPAVSLQANLGYYGGQFGLKSPFAHYNHDVSALAVVTVPIFTGGLISSQIRQAAETNNVDRIAIEASRRQVMLTATQAWNALVGARARLLAQFEQVRSATAAFEGSRLEAASGIRTTLDVLISEQDLQAARIALATARADVLVAASALLAAEGQLDIADFAPNVPIYDPQRNTNHLHHLGPPAPLKPIIAQLDWLGAPNTEGSGVIAK